MEVWQPESLNFSISIYHSLDCFTLETFFILAGGLATSLTYVLPQKENIVWPLNLGDSIFSELGKLHSFCNAIPILDTWSKMYCDTDTRYLIQNVLHYRYSLLVRKNVSQICNTRYCHLNSETYKSTVRIGVEDTSGCFCNENSKYWLLTLEFEAFNLKCHAFVWF